MRCHTVRFGNRPYEVHDEREECERRGEKGIRIEKLYSQVQTGIPVWFSFFVSNLLPLGVKIIIYFSISDGHHDNQDPEKDHADQELVHHPHRNNCSLQVFGSLTPRNNVLRQVVS